MDASSPSRLRRPAYLASLPERAFRAAAAALGGAAHETAVLVLPRVFRRSRLYEATAKNVLRVAIELVGAVEGSPTAEPAAGVGQIAVRKGVGNVVELGSIAAFGFSPLWLLAGASDVLRGTRTYLQALSDELREAGVLAENVEVGTVDELLGVLERTSGRTAGLIDIPPLELAELRRSLAELGRDAGELPSPAELARLFDGLRFVARREDQSLLQVSSGIGLAFLTSARKLGREHLAVPYREDWKPLRREGFGAYARRVARPYGEAIGKHFDPQRVTWTQRLLDRLRGR